MSCSRGIQAGSKAGVCLAIMQDDAVIGLNSARIPKYLYRVYQEASFAICSSDGHFTGGLHLNATLLCGVSRSPGKSVLNAYRSMIVQSKAKVHTQS